MLKKEMIAKLNEEYVFACKYHQKYTDTDSENSMVTFYNGMLTGYEALLGIEIQNSFVGLSRQDKAERIAHYSKK